MHQLTILFHVLREFLAHILAHILEVLRVLHLALLMNESFILGVVSWDLWRRIVADRRNTHRTIDYTRGRPVHNCSCAVQNTKAMT